MKKLNLLAALTGLIFTLALQAQDKQIAIQLPEKPKQGDNVSITYNTASGQAILKDAQNIMLYLMAMDQDYMYNLKEIPMTKSGSIWTASVKLNKEVFFTYYFDDGNNQDWNNDAAWVSMVYNAKGQPLQGANYFMANLYRNGGFIDFKFTKSKEKSDEYIAKEIAAYPASIQANSTKWNSMLREKPGDETINIVKKELDKVYNLNKNDEKATYTLSYWYTKTKQEAKANEIKNAWIKKNPKGYTAKSSAIEDFYNTEDSKKTVELGKNLLDNYPDLEPKEKESVYSVMISAYVGLKDYENAEKMLKESGLKNSSLYNSLAWPLIEKGEQLEKATKWANEGMKLAENPDPSNKPPYYSTKTWKQQNEQSLGMISDTYGYGLFQLGYSIAAEKQYEKSFTILKGDDEDVNSRYVACLINNGNYAKAVEVSDECLSKEKTNEALLKNYKIAWLKLGKSEADFDAKVGKLNANAKEAALEKMKKEMVNKPAIDFSLKSLDGKTVKLSDLKGKIVVIDFWATWCGPCKASFPTLQKITEKYKDNPNIVILALDTWEQVSGDERTKKVKEFIESNKYTFTVLFDEDFVTKYEVSGIPTKFIVDRYGKIQFKTVGFSGETKMLSEMEAQFEMLLKDDYLKELN
ncbi:MAG: TlpA disulfide reductase family protein [Bacteroidales bacterium]